MPRPTRKEIPTSDPDLLVVICDDGSRTLKCKRRNVTWHSESGALAESQLVFLQNSGVAEMLESAAEPCRALEVGFGTGLNFWLTATLALRNSAILEYVSYEPNLLRKEVLDAMEYSKLESCRPAMDSFSATAGRQVVDGVSLELIEERIENTEVTPASFDAIYHDPFSPESAPDLWTESLFANLFESLKPNGKLVTYCVKSEIQRRLKRVGFEVSKTKGPRGGKREVLVATRGL